MANSIDPNETWIYAVCPVIRELLTITECTPEMEPANAQHCNNVISMLPQHYNIMVIAAT